jgi:uncharacterized membrane protein YbhN (UPF0104 family)
MAVADIQLRVSNGVLRRALLFAVKLFVTAAILAMLGSKVGMSRIAEQIHAPALAPLALALAIATGQLVVGAARWQLLLKGLCTYVRFGATLRLFAIGAFFNICLPTGLGGDLYRIWGLRRATVATRAAINSVVVERLCVVSSLLLLVLAQSPWLFGRLQPGAAVATLALLCLIGLVAIAFMTVADRFPDGGRRWLPLAWAGALAGDLRRVLWHRATLVPSAVLSVLAIAAYCSVVYFAAWSLGIELTALACALLVPTAMMAMLVPITVGGWGVREGAMVFALQGAGIVPEQALAVSILVGIIFMGTSLVGGLAWLFSRDGASQSRMA